MKVALIRIPKNKYTTIPEKIIGMFVWEEGRWEVYAPPAIKAKIDDIGDLRVEFCVETKRAIIRKEQLKKRTELDWLNGAFGVLRWDFKPTLGIGDIETFTKDEVRRFKDIFSLLKE